MAKVPNAVEILQKI